MRKDKLDKLIEKAKKLFEELPASGGKKTILTGKGLTRKELRILERKGLVRKMSIYQEKKYKDSPSTMGYVWEWVGDKDAAR